MDKGGRIAALAYVLFTAFVFFLVVFATDITSLTRSPKTAFSTLLLAICSVPLFLFVLTRCNNHAFNSWLRSNLKRVVLIGSGLFFLLQLAIIASLTYVDIPNPTDTDIILGYSTRSAKSDTSITALGMYPPYYLDSFDQYFSMYSNNIPLSLWFRLLNKTALFFGIDPRFFIAATGGLLVNVSGIVTAFTVFKYSNRPVTAFFAWLGYSLLATLSPMNASPYSDSFSIAFVAAGIASFLSFASKEAYARSLALFACSIVFISLGALIKPTLLVLVAAIVVFGCFRFLAKDISARQFVSCAVVLVLVLSSCLGILQPAAKSLYIGALDAELAMPWQHFLNMGLNPDTNGDVTIDDINFARAIQTNAERKNACLESAQKRFVALAQERRLSIFYTKKTLLTFSDGTFSYPGARNPNKTEGDTLGPLGNWIRDLYLFREGHTPPTRDVEQAVWVVMLSLLPFCGLWYNHLEKTRKRQVLFLFIAFFGVVVFQTLFETRTRYLFCWLPLFSLLASGGMDSILAIRPILPPFLSARQRQDQTKDSGVRPV